MFIVSCFPPFLLSSVCLSTVSHYCYTCSSGCCFPLTRRPRRLPSTCLKFLLFTVPSDWRNSLIALSAVCVKCAFITLAVSFTKQAFLIQFLVIFLDATQGSSQPFLREYPDWRGTPPMCFHSILCIFSLKLLSVNRGSNAPLMFVS